MRVRRTSLIACLALAITAVSCLAQPTPNDQARSEFFETRVRPLLASRCMSCHGPTVQQGGLRLDSAAALQKGGRGGEAVVPGHPETSRLILAVTYQNAALQMPPTGKLSDDQIAALTTWVREGAYWPDHAGKPAPAASTLWSTRPIRRPVPPAVARRAWVRSTIDAFVLRALERRGLSPSPPANRRDLLRRLYFDLTGLPPQPQEVRDFLADRSSTAYEKVVDRLLASPRYGERWARYWLDLVRYADTNGYERDAEKPYSWKYRDYVIRSLNQDKPFNRFVLEQLAGDELPDRSEETVTATGFLRLGTWDDEPNDALDYKYERLDDLVHTTSTAFLGLTVRCARCHDHKFDPIPQRDYYAIGAAFYGGYLDPGDGKLMGGPPPDRLKYPVLGFTDRGRSAPPLHRLIGGDARREAEVVEPGYLSMVPSLRPAVYPPSPDTQTSERRLRLARWIVDPRNPLTARVIVNRIWQYHFGQGLVRTPNNFGHKGDLPTHPDLLDWLADVFKDEGGRRSGKDEGRRMKDEGTARPPSSAFIVRPFDRLNAGSSSIGCGWSIKRLHRLMLLSNTYRMASVHPLQERYQRTDPSDTMLWHFPRRRLDADALRDSILAVSGQLNLKETGRGFVPTVTHEALEGLSRKGAEWQPSAPEEQNRRTIYMFLKRALIMPLLTVFDFADTTQPLEQRDVSLVAPQALALLNNPFLQAQSESFARRVYALAGRSRERQIDMAWLLALGRSPTAAERSASLAHLRRVETAATAQAKRTEQGPSPTMTASLWLRADHAVEVDADGRVARWGDATGRFAAEQPVASARPQRTVDAAGRPALRFDGRGRYLQMPDAPIESQQFTIIAVACDRATGDAHREIFSNWNRDGNIDTSVFLGLTGASNVRLTDHFAPAGTVQDASHLFVLTAVAGSGEAAVYQNRTELARIANSLPPRRLAGPYVIGQQGNINGEYWNGDILEIQVYNRALSQAEREAAWDDLAKRYRIAPREKQVDAALTSLCHVLFNANEFIYID